MSSQALHRNVEVTDVDINPGRGDHSYPPQSAPLQEPRGVSNFVDGSGPIFSMYLEMATEEDKKMVEGWKADADGILIFTGLFSAAVASLISVTIQDIRPNPQDTSNFYLANIYQTLANPNVSSSLPTSPPPFSPPNHAVWVNALWFLSLVISITCALLATLLQQWARRYLKVTQPHYSPHKRARIRAFFFEGVDKFLVPWAVEALPTLLHVSLFLFFGGISVFLWNVNLTIFKSVLSWIGACTALYGCITLVPIFRHDSPYHTPLSLPARPIVTGISYAIFRALRRLTLLDFFSAESYIYFQSLEERYRKLLVQGMQKTSEEAALNAPSEIDTRALMWTFDSLDEDHELERFFSGLPGFRRSRVVEDPLPNLTEEQKEKLSAGLMGLLDVTFSSDLLPEPVKDRRAIICAKACDPAHVPSVFDICDRILSRYQYSGPVSTEIMQVMSGWSNNRNNAELVATICMTVARVQRRDHAWFILASDELGVQEPVLREYAAHGDDLSLAVLIHIARQQFSRFEFEPDFEQDSWPTGTFWKVLEAASKFNVQDTSPDLQHEFCILWNQIVLRAKSPDSQWMAAYILGPICNVYTGLHPETDSAAIGGLWDPFSFPSCNVPGHRPDSAPHIHDDSALGDSAALVPASLARAESPFSSIPAPLQLHVDEGLADMLPLDGFHSAHQTIIEVPRTPVTSPGPATAGAVRDITTSGKAVPHSAPKSSISTTTSPLAVFSIQHNDDLLAPSDGPSLAAYNTVLDNRLPTESRRPIVVTATPGASPGPTSDLGVATEDDDSQKPGLRENRDALDPLSVNRVIHAITMPTLGLPSQPPSLPSVPDSNIAITGPSMWEPDAERTGDPPPHPSRGRYNIV